MNIEGHPIEILALETANCADPGPTNGDPLCLFTFRQKPNKGPSPWVLMLTPEQCVRIRDTLDNLFLNDPEWVIYVPSEKQEEIST